MDFKEIALQIFKSAIESVLPENLIKNNLKIQNSNLIVEKDQYKISKIHVFGSGKASVRMAQAIEDILLDKIENGVVVCNYTQNLKKIKVVEGSHPVPTEKSLKAGEILLNEMSKLSENVVALAKKRGPSSSYTLVPSSSM